MSTYQSSGKASTKGLRIALFVVIALFATVALVLGLCLNKKTELVVTPENNVKTESLDTSALLSSDGWNESLALGLYRSLSNVGDNVALGNAGGKNSAKVISLGGYKWSVVYKQNGIVTLYASEPVAYLSFDDDSANYAESAIRAYLNGEFYADFVQKIGFANFENMLVPYGVSELYYQLNGAQAIPLSTVYNDEISGCDGVKNDKIWLPSAYEVGGFASTETSPKARVNSFRTIHSDGLAINSGLWNLSNDTRLQVNDAVLRSGAADGVCVIKNGVITAGNVQNTYAIRPCFNIMMPEIVDGAVLNANDTQYVSNEALFASTVPSFANLLHEYTTETSGNVYTAKSGNVTVDGVSYTNSQMLLSQLAQAVNLGASMSGCTFKLSSDVDMSIFTIWSPIGRDDFAFSGVFDGQGYKITNLCSAGSGFVGLFGSVAGASAAVKNVAVTNSSWYTTNNNVGSIAGIITNGATIEACYSECGISGGSYVGGIVGKSTASSTIKNCYNKNGISGIDYVGGIIGYNNGTAISYSYNVGAVTGNSTHIGGLIGQNQSGTITASVYNNENSSNASVSGVTGAAYTAMQGQKTSSGVTKPTSMSGWTFSGSPWMISAVENDRLPMLKTFLKTVTISVRSGDSINKVSINNGAYSSSATVTQAASSSTITIKAQANFSGTNHYKLASWKMSKGSVGDTIVSTGTFASAGDATTDGNYKIFTLTVTADDSYDLEAEFEKMYEFGWSALFNGFSNTTSYTGSEFGLSSSVGGFSNYWYPKGAKIYLTIGEPSGRYWELAGFQGSSDGGSTWTNLSIGEANSDAFLTKGSSNGQYVVNMGHSSAFVTNDSYKVRPVFDRYYNVTIDNVVPTVTNGPTVVTKIVFSNPSATVKSSDSTKTAKIKYNGTLATSIDTASSAWSNVYAFQNWQLLNGTTLIGSSMTNATNNVTIPTQSDSVINLTLKSTFGLAQKTVTLKELVGSTETSSAGYAYLDTNGSLSTITQDKLTLSVPYGTTVYAYILPAYASGYTLSTFNSAAATPDSAGMYKVSITANSTATYNVVYALASKFNISFAAKLDGAASTGVFTFNPTSYSNQVITTNISGAKVTNEAGKYVLQSVTATYNGKTGTVVSNSRPSSGYVAQTTNNVFDGLGSTQTIAALLSKISSPAVYNNYNISVTVNFISIVRTITVTEVWNGVTPNGGTKTLTHAAAYSIQDTTANKTVSGQGTLNNAHKVTANPGAGYRVSSITGSGVTVTQSINSTWGTSSTATFTLSNNVSITITYQARPYTITAQDKVNGTVQSINTFTFKIGGTTVTPASGNKVYANYGETVTISGYSVLKTNSTNADQKYELRSISLSQGTSPTTITQEWTKTCTDSNDAEVVTFNYVILQKVTISVSDASSTATASANKVLVVLKSKTAGNPNIVILATKGQSGIYADCVLNAQYEVSSIVPVYVSSTVNSSTGSTYTLTVGTGSSVSVSLMQDLANGNVYAQQIFG